MRSLPRTRPFDLDGLEEYEFVAVEDELETREASAAAQRGSAWDLELVRMSSCLEGLGIAARAGVVLAAPALLGQPVDRFGSRPVAGLVATLALTVSRREGVRTRPVEFGWAVLF